MSNSNTNLQTQSSNALHNAIMEAGSKDHPPMLALGSSETTTERYMENYKNVSQDIRDQLNAEAEAIQIILTGIDNDIYSTVESINVQDLKTNLYWEFGKLTSRDGESLKSYYSWFYKMMSLIQEVTPDPVDNSGPIFDDEPKHRDPNITIDFIGSYVLIESQDDAQFKFYKTRKDKELDKVIALENKVKFLKERSKSSNPRLYDIGFYNDNLALMLAPESDETIRLDKESRSKLSDLIRPFDYDQLNNLYDLFIPQREKSPEQHYFPRTSKMSHTSSNNEFSKDSFRKQTTLLEKRMDEAHPWDHKVVSRPQLKSNQLKDRVMSNNSQGKKQEVEDHRRNFKFSNNKMSVTACNASLNLRPRLTRQPIDVPISSRQPKHNVNQSAATSSKKTITTDSIVKKSRHTTRKLYVQL
ncbi:hypothetical protein Tco_1006568 [Tanacetum coccineum]|uniref:Uncharacterized protein n=1 Tax=Tanacetum coccineum TaxID=301880 RepID=A0ABQ5FI34_9ASTR